eukprot:750662-Hanusia_phi.AAC.1
MQIVDECISNPDKPVPAGTRIAVQRYIPICRRYENLESLGLSGVDFIYCSLHLKMRICNTIIKFVHSMAENNRVLPSVNDFFERNCVPIKLSVKRLQEYRSQLDGKQCNELINALPELIRIVCKDSDKVRLWDETISEFCKILDILETQHYNRINPADVQSLPFLTRSFSYNLIKLIGDAKLLQSFYLHSLCVGHVSEQMMYLYN